MTFNQTTPQASDKLRNFPSDMQTNEWPRVFANINADHNFQNTAGSSLPYGVDITGYHKVTRMIQQGADPATGVQIGALYCKDIAGFNNLVYRVPSSGQIIQLTNSASTINQATDGEAVLIGGLIMKWGTLTPNSTVTRTVTFAPAFPNNLFHVQVTPQRTTSDPGSTFVYYVDNTTLSASGFNIINRTTHTYGFYWLAIGV